MTNIDLHTTATDLSDNAMNSKLIEQGYSIRHIETWHRNDHSDSIIVWDNPTIAETDLPY